jgi:hypothetical protein
MLTRAFNGFVVLGGAAATAVMLDWLMIDGLGLHRQSVLEGVLIAAAAIGMAYLGDIIPRPDKSGGA